MKFISKIIITVVVVLIVLAGAWFALMKAGVFDTKGEELKIDTTANVISEIKKISEFTTACFYEEITLNEAKVRENVVNTTGNKIVKFFDKEHKAKKKDQLLIIANGQVRAGFDLSQMTDEDFVFTDSLVTVTLPKAKIFDVIVNPSDFDIYIEEGEWTHEQVTTVENKAKSKIETDAKKNEILAKATTNGIARMTELLKTFGYDNVKVLVKK